MFHNGAQKTGCRRLSVGSRDRQHIALSKSVSQFHFSPDLQAFFLKMENQGKVCGNTGA